ncbi:Mrr restriction system protein [Levilactobacillus paucivorans]|uniref:Mrr restriction system protein n=1 Tax=Levilactobacillus paucivorans TaxID=616990 RepID=A0A0R2LQ18_9LACO|nr:restriction endonuclease [Levilactobacillus paucivorans]KRO02107.1 Mrr restriction system protein [Levilactobacillus paucivorans]
MTYQDLKLGEHGLPTWDALAPSVLKLASQRGEWRGRELRVAVADSLKLPNDLREMTYSSHKSITIIEDRAGWAISELKTGGLLKRKRRGYYQISSSGRELLSAGHLIDQNVIHNQPLYLQHKKELNERKKRGNESKVTVPKTALVLEQLAEQSQAYNAEVATDLLQRIREADPTFFENLVVKLLVAMGYKGPNGSAWVTQKTNDGGIDGVINQDALGTNTVYVQAKRYGEDNRVQRPVIDSFYGALKRNHADRGVLITTSGFSSAALKAAKEFSIVLIDGIQLTDLMLEYHVGVQVKQQFEFFEIDEDFFDD